LKHNVIANATGLRLGAALPAAIAAGEAGRRRPLALPNWPADLSEVARRSSVRARGTELGDNRPLGLWRVAAPPTAAGRRELLPQTACAVASSPPQDATGLGMSLDEGWKTCG